MRFFITVLFLGTFGSITGAGVGDVHYCDMKNLTTFENHKYQSWATQKFKFIWASEYRNKMGSDDNYFENLSSILCKSWPNQESFVDNIEENIGEFLKKEVIFISLFYV